MIKAEDGVLNNLDRMKLIKYILLNLVMIAGAIVYEIELLIYWRTKK